MSTHSVWLATLAVALGVGCVDESPDRVVAPRLEDVHGAFDYRAYDATGQLLLVGRIRLEAGDDSTLTGTWEIGWAPGADTSTTVGPQVGSGRLGGRHGEGHTLIDLNPGWADNNVYLLAGNANEGTLSGRWHHSTLIGPVADGPFALHQRAE